MKGWRGGRRTCNFEKLEASTGGSICAGGVRELLINSLRASERSLRCS